MHLMDGHEALRRCLYLLASGPPDDSILRIVTAVLICPISGVSQQYCRRQKCSLAQWENCVMEMTGEHVFIIRSFQDKDKDQSLRMPVQPYDVTELQKYANTKL